VSPPTGAARLFVLERRGGLRLEISDLGASWVSCRVPLRDATSREVLLGYERLESYLDGNAYFGATVGRYANRIGGARYVRNGREVRLAANQWGNQLHGGPDGFSARRWDVLDVTADAIDLGLHSADGDQGFPGAVDVRVRYRLDSDTSVRIEFVAEVTRETPLALTNHALLNLDAAHIDVRDNSLRIAADHYVPIDAELIPLGTLSPVPVDFDFRISHRIGRDFLASGQQRQVDGYDHAFLLDPACRDGSKAAAELTSSDGHLTASLYTDQPALQFYSGNFLEGTSRRGGGTYRRYAGLALEPGLPPDSPNRPEWGKWSDCFVQPGRSWRAFLRWDFHAQ
jgi:aldose 1-epimerase